VKSRVRTETGNRFIFKRAVGKAAAAGRLYDMYDGARGWCGCCCLRDDAQMPMQKREKSGRRSKGADGRRADGGAVCGLLGRAGRTREVGCTEDKEAWHQQEARTSKWIGEGEKRAVSAGSTATGQWESCAAHQRDSLAGTASRARLGSPRMPRGLGP